MTEYIVEFNKTQYDEMVADGILKEANNPTLYGMPVQGEVIRCRDCKKHFTDDEEPGMVCRRKVKNAFDFEIEIEFKVEPDGFCAWAERDA